MAKLYYLQLTRECNQNCRFCSNPSNGSVISAEKAGAMMRDYAKRKASGIIFTGGEPTLHPKLPDFIAYARTLGMEPRIVTNGQRTADLKYFSRLCRAGLRHLHVSIHSHVPALQEHLSRTKGSLTNLFSTLDNAAKLGVSVNVNTVINRYNSGHLHLAARFLCAKYPFISHFVFNNMDPGMERVVEFPDTIPTLSGFEASLAAAMRFLEAGGRTFRVERVPLCFMAEFAHCSTETRKIVKGENRLTYFLDEKELIVQEDWSYGKGGRCAACTLKRICAGLYKKDVYYKSEELCPMFSDPAAIAARILGR
ncbi:MAG: radical SAM protein [Elusimicrobia bacterium]|nr:radical SAM protein [Elusimicrobiota bacterium]